MFMFYYILPLSQVFTLGTSKQLKVVIIKMVLQLLEKRLLSVKYIFQSNVKFSEKDVCCLR